MRGKQEYKGEGNKGRNQDTLSGVGTGAGPTGTVG
jgi:hypothetical protein